MKMGSELKLIFIVFVLLYEVIVAVNNLQRGVITKEIIENEKLMSDIRKKIIEDSRDDNVTCPFPYGVLQDRCILVLHLEAGSWRASRYECERLQGDLVKLDDANVMGHLVKHINANGFIDFDYWIGATDETWPGNWTWVDGSQMRMGTPFWGTWIDLIQRPINEDAHCGILNKDDHFFIYEADCYLQTLGAICEYPDPNDHN